MIVSKNTVPDKDLYYVGALVLDTLDNSDEDQMDFFPMYELLKSQHGLSIGTFNQALDWLFIIGAIDSSKGRIVKCF